MTTGHRTISRKFFPPMAMGFEVNNLEIEAIDVLLAAIGKLQVPMVDAIRNNLLKMRVALQTSLSEEEQGLYAIAILAHQSSFRKALVIAGEVN